MDTYIHRQPKTESLQQLIRANA